MAKTPPAAEDAPVLDDSVELPDGAEATPRRSWRERLRLPALRLPALRLPGFMAKLPMPRIALPKKMLIIIAASVVGVAGAGALAYAFWPREPDWPRTPVVAKKARKAKHHAKAASAASSAAALAAASASAADGPASAVAVSAPASGPEEPMDRLRRRLGEVMGQGGKVQNDGPGELRLTARDPAHGAAAERPAVRAAAARANGGGKADAPAPAPGEERVPSRHAAGHRADDGHGEAPALAKSHDPLTQGHLGWSYSGPTGPDAWARLKPEYAKCGNGARQSPIDIRDGIQVQLDPVKFEYQPSGFAVIDNGHTVQVNVAPGNFIEVGGRRYELQQFHFHRPSEERVDGRQFDMVAHLVHKDAEGRLAVVAVLLERGAAQSVVQSVWNNLPLEKGEEQPAQTSIDLNQLLPADRSYFTYMGSLTTPPCSEGVLWMVMKKPVGVSPEQINIFARLYPMNARPLQAASGRMIKESASN